jgi:hypothetical protein
MRRRRPLRGYLTDDYHPNSISQAELRISANERFPIFDIVGYLDPTGRKSPSLT